VIGNTMWDPIAQKSFSIYDNNAQRDPLWWDEGEPIWVTAVLQNQISATYFWPGSEARIRGIRANYSVIYDGEVSNWDRVDGVIDWLLRPISRRPTFLCLYFSQVDSMGHEVGPDNRTEMSAAIKYVDDSIGYLISRLQDIGYYQEVNIVITSDHGMANISESRVILIDNYINMSDISRIVDFTPVLAIYPKQGKDILLRDQLNTAHPEMKAYLREEIPERWHYLSNHRVTPLIAVANEGWSISTTDFFNKNRNTFNGGSHGYDNKNHDMRAIFIANGPDFGKGKIIKPFENVNVYSTLCKVLNLIPSPNNGTVITEAFV